MSDHTGRARDPVRDPMQASFPGFPDIRRIGVADIRAALAEGWRDFARAPLWGLFFGGAYAVGGLALAWLVASVGAGWAIIPLGLGFPLIGPFVAVGLYEISRRLDAGRPLDIAGVLGVVFEQRNRQLAWMAFVMLFVFWIWAYQVRLLLALFLGFSPFSSFEGFLAVMTTPAGIEFLAVGTIVGAVLALGLFTLTVVSTPLLLERDLDIVTAIVASVTAVRRSPIPMLGWGVVVTLTLLLAMAPLFLGLVVALPVLGHATWRLYRKIVGPAAG